MARPSLEPEVHRRGELAVLSLRGTGSGGHGEHGPQNKTRTQRGHQIVLKCVTLVSEYRRERTGRRRSPILSPTCWDTQVVPRWEESPYVPRTTYTAAPERENSMTRPAPRREITSAASMGSPRRAK